MAYKAEGRLHKIFDAEQKTASFQAREFVIEITEGQFPQMIKFQLVQDKCALLDDYSEGDQLVVDFDLRGREWNDKYFTNLNAWSLARSDGQSAAEAGGGSGAGADQALPLGQATTPDFDDDIPF